MTYLLFNVISPNSVGQIKKLNVACGPSFAHVKAKSWLHLSRDGGLTPLLDLSPSHLFVPAGMCNPKNYSDSPATSKSTVEELHRPIPSLFRALTEGDAPINMMVVSFPVAEELSHHENLVSFLESLDSQAQNVSVPGNSIHASYDSQGRAWNTTRCNLVSVLFERIHDNPRFEILFLTFIVK